MTRDKASKTLILSVAATVLAALLLWGASAAASSKLDTSRFVADSIRRDGVQQAIRIQQLADSVVLRRIDERVGRMYCAQVPTQLREACQ